MGYCPKDNIKISSLADESDWKFFHYDFFTSNFLPPDFSCCHLDNAWAVEINSIVVIVVKSNSIHKSEIFYQLVLLDLFCPSHILMIDLLSQQFLILDLFVMIACLWESPCLVCVSWRMLVILSLMTIWKLLEIQMMLHRVIKIVTSCALYHRSNEIICLSIFCRWSSISWIDLFAVNDVNSSCRLLQILIYQDLLEPE